MSDIIKSAVTPHFRLELDAEDGTPPKVWKLAYTYKAIAKIEAAIGKDIKKVDAWKDLSSGTDFPVIVWGGLDKFNPEVTLDEVLDILNPQAQRLLSDAIFDLMFPGLVDAYKATLTESAQGTGATDNPNGQTGTTTV